MVAERHGEEGVFLDARMAIDQEIVKIVVSSEVLENFLECVEIEACLENGENLVQLVSCGTEDQASRLQLDFAGKIDNGLANRNLVLKYIVNRRSNIRVRDSEDNVKPRALQVQVDYSDSLSQLGKGDSEV